VRPNLLRRYEKYIHAEGSSGLVFCLGEHVTHRSLWIPYSKPTQSVSLSSHYPLLR